MAVMAKRPQVSGDAEVAESIDCLSVSISLSCVPSEGMLCTSDGRPHCKVVGSSSMFGGAMSRWSDGSGTIAISDTLSLPPDTHFSAGATFANCNRAQVTRNLACNHMSCNGVLPRSKQRLAFNSTNMAMNSMATPDVTSEAPCCSVAAVDAPNPSGAMSHSDAGPMPQCCSSSFAYRKYNSKPTNASACGANTPTNTRIAPVCIKKYAVQVARQPK
mmetsp:Transcript_96093/g.277521  ORF Transcript_96093/g.277521 Transcript_96093/m.277521 type:complete len:217 (-) Transcript_96093:596-1246(-)